MIFKDKQRGDTLVEVVMAFAILSLVLTTTVGLTTSAMRTAQLAKQRTQATAMSQSISELLINSRDKQIASSTTGWNNFIDSLYVPPPSQYQKPANVTQCSSDPDYGLLDINSTSKLKAITPVVNNNIYNNINSATQQTPSGTQPYTSIKTTTGSYVVTYSICDPSTGATSAYPSSVQITTKISWGANQKYKSSSTMVLSNIGGSYLTGSIGSSLPNVPGVLAISSGGGPYYINSPITITASSISTNGSALTDFKIVDDNSVTYCDITNPTSSTVSCPITFPASPTNNLRLHAVATNSIGSVSSNILTFDVIDLPAPIITTFFVRGSHSGQNDKLWESGQQYPKAPGSPEQAYAYWSTSNASSCKLTGRTPAASVSSNSPTGYLLSGFNNPSGTGTDNLGGVYISNNTYSETLTCNGIPGTSPASQTINVIVRSCNPQKNFNWGTGAAFGYYSYVQSGGIHTGNSCGAL